MKKILTTTLLSLGLLTVSVTALNASVEKGQKLYSKKLKKHCGISGAKMAGKHSQEEWETIMEEGKLKDEIKSICPGVKEKGLKDKFIQHYFDFFYEFGNDSGNVPSC